MCDQRLSEIAINLKIMSEIKIFSTNLHEIFQLKLKLFPFIDLIGLL